MILNPKIIKGETICFLIIATKKIIAIAKTQSRNSHQKFQNVPIPSAGMTTAAILIVVAGPDLPDPPDRVAALGQEAALDPWVPPDLPELQALPALPVLLDLPDLPDLWARSDLLAPPALLVLMG